MKNSKEIGLTNEEVLRRRKRLAWSIMLLNAGPFIYAIIIILLLGGFKYSPATPEGLLEGVWLMFITLWAGLGVFGFQRIYACLALCKREIFRKAYRRQILQRGSDPKPQRIAILYYLALPIITLLAMRVCIRFGFNLIIGFLIFIGVLLGLFTWLFN